MYVQSILNMGLADGALPDRGAPPNPNLVGKQRLRL